MFPIRLAVRDVVDEVDGSRQPAKNQKQGFRKNGQKIKVKPVDAYIYHYGWVKPPAGLGNKMQSFNKFYHDDQWISNTYPEEANFDYGNADRLLHFKETHPSVMQKRIEAVNWKFNLDPTQLPKKMTFRRRFLQKLEDLTGWRLGEYKNYKLL